MELKVIEAGRRGLRRAEFVDCDGRPCIIMESSLATERAIRLGKRDLDKMHLTQEQVAALLPLLQRFVETGELS